jgi:hypothetical protein
MEVSFADCKRELLGRANANGRAAYNEWRQRPNWDEVVAFVEGFTHRHERLIEVKTTNGSAPHAIFSDAKRM